MKLSTLKTSWNSHSQEVRSVTSFDYLHSKLLDIMVITTLKNKKVLKAFIEDEFSLDDCSIKIKSPHDWILTHPLMVMELYLKDSTVQLGDYTFKIRDFTKVKVSFPESCEDYTLTYR